MAITAASIESSGWVLRVIFGGTTGSFTSYTLDPDGVQAVTLSAVSTGYAPAGATVAAAATVRRLIATKPLRKAVQASNAGTRAARAVDETDNGDGTITVRLALSQHIYAGDSALSLTVRAGWRTGESAQTIAVTNGATLLAPQPLVRWSDVPYQLVEGSFDLEVVVASHHPAGLAPVAGVRFTVTDGTTIKTVWATALSTSTRYQAGGTGQGVRVYKATVDPAVATALTKGLLRCDYEVFPWVGAARLSDPAGTKSMTGLGTASLSGGAQVPFVVAYNAGGTWVTPRYAYVDPASTASSSAANVGTSAAAAAATPLPSINRALESLRLHAVANPSTGTLAAANGQAAITASVDGCRIRLAAGVHPGTGTTVVGTGIQSPATWVVIEGDPAATDPRANVIVRTPASANGNSRATRVQFRRLRIEAGSNAIITSTHVWLDDTELRGQAGSETGSTVPITATGTHWLTNTRWWRYGIAPSTSGTTQSPQLVRNCEVERQLGAPVLLNNKRLPSSVAGTSGVSGGSPTSPSTNPLGQDRIVIGNDLRYISGATALGWSYLDNASAPAAPLPGNALGTAYPVVARQAFINNVCETYGASFPMMLPAGENLPAVSTDTILEGNTFAGDRLNMIYNDLNMPTIALNDSENAVALLNRVANNVTAKTATKHDRFNDGEVQLQRQGTSTYSLASSRSKTKAVGAELTANGNLYRCTVAGTTAASGGPSGTGGAITDGTVTWAWFAVADPRQHGYRPQATGSWSAAYGVGWEGNIDFQAPSQGDPEFYHEYFGIGSLQCSAEGVTLTTSPYTLDKSGTTIAGALAPWMSYNSANTGGGNYRPLATGSGTAIAGRARSGNVDRDQSGSGRLVPFAAGALESLAVACVPASARHATGSTAPAVSWRVSLAAGKSRHAIASTATAVNWRASLTAGKSRHAVASTVAASSWRTSVNVTASRLSTRARAGAIGWTVVLLPEGARSATVAQPIVLTAFAAVGLVPAGTRHAVRDRTEPLVRPATVTPLERTLIVTGDFRLGVVNPN